MPIHATTTMTHDRKALLAALAEQKRLVDELAVLAGRQQDAVREQDGDTLLELLSRRQRLIDRIVVAQSEMTALLPQSGPGGRLSSADDPDDWRPVAQIIEQIERTLADVIQQDDTASEAIRAVRDRARAEIKSFGQTQQARRAYGPPSGAGGGHTQSSSPRFSDSKG